MRPRTLVLLLTLVLVLPAGLGIVWFMENYERQSREVRTGLSVQARRNPYLAGERFLDRLGYRVESVSGRDRLLHPPLEPGLLLVRNMGMALAPEREKALLAWVRRGGHLVTAPSREWDQETLSSGNGILDRLGVELVLLPAGESEETGSAGTDGEFRHPATRAVLPDGVTGIDLAFSPGRVLVEHQPQARWRVESDAGAHLLQYAVGDGVITVLSDTRLFTNERIGEQDHALLLAYLMDGQRNAWLLYSSDMPSLLALVWRYAPELLSSLLLLVLLAVWRMSGRSGPILCDGGEARRDLMEHLEAAAGYSWRIDRSRRLVAASREAVGRAWLRRNPALGSLDTGRRSEWIAQQTGLTRQAVEKALGAGHATEQEFIRMSVSQQRLAAGASRAGERER